MLKALKTIIFLILSIQLLASFFAGGFLCWQLRQEPNLVIAGVAVLLVILALVIILFKLLGQERKVAYFLVFAWTVFVVIRLTYYSPELLKYDFDTIGLLYNRQLAFVFDFFSFLLLAFLCLIFIIVKFWKDRSNVNMTGTQVAGGQQQSQGAPEQCPPEADDSGEPKGNPFACSGCGTENSPFATTCSKCGCGING